MLNHVRVDGGRREVRVEYASGVTITIQRQPNVEPSTAATRSLSDTESKPAASREQIHYADRIRQILIRRAARAQEFGVLRASTTRARLRHAHSAALRATGARVDATIPSCRRTFSPRAGARRVYVSSVGAFCPRSMRLISVCATPERCASSPCVRRSSSSPCRGWVAVRLASTTAITFPDGSHKE